MGRINWLLSDISLLSFLVFIYHSFFTISSCLLSFFFSLCVFFSLLFWSFLKDKTVQQQPRNSEAFKSVILNGFRNKRKIDFSEQVIETSIKIRSEQNEGQVIYKPEPEEFEFSDSGKTAGRRQCTKLSCFKIQETWPLALVSGLWEMLSCFLSISLLGCSL